MLQTHMEKINKQYGTNINLKETTLRQVTKMEIHKGEKLEFIRQIAELA